MADESNQLDLLAGLTSPPAKKNAEAEAESPVAEAPVAEAPVAEAPVEKAPVAEAAANEPATDDAAAEESPAKAPIAKEPPKRKAGALTSASHPLRVGWIPTPSGKLGLAFAPGRRDVSSYTGAQWDRDLTADLARLKEFGATVLVVLMGDDELEAIGVPTLVQAGVEIGLETLQCAVVDGEAPADELGRQTAISIIDALKNNQVVILTSRGGQGRTGTLAAQVLVGFGQPAKEAVATLRDARGPHCPSEAGEAWVASHAVDGESDASASAETKDSPAKNADASADAKADEAPPVGVAVDDPEDLSDFQDGDVFASQEFRDEDFEDESFGDASGAERESEDETAAGDEADAGDAAKDVAEVESTDDDDDFDDRPTLRPREWSASHHFGLPGIGEVSGAFDLQEAPQALSPEWIARDPRMSRMAGAVLGGAIGDAVGHPTEFVGTFDGIRERWGPEGVTGYELWWEKGGRRFAPYTDDTQMAEVVLRTLLWGRRADAGLDATMRMMAQGFIKWSDHPQGGHRAPGNACLAGCRALARGEPWHLAGGATAGGCGSVMRAYPFGLVFADDLARAERWAVAHSKLTHRDPIALAASAAMAVGVARTLRGEDPIYVASEMIAAACRYSARTGAMMAEAMSEAQNGTEPEVTLQRLQGWAAHEAIAAAVYLFVRHPDDPRAAILEGANTPGDSDSLATLAGALTGARCGLGAIPEDWVRDVERSQALLTLGAAI
ncbi:MAG: ADP-ribosylglycohydrolase family protein [Myxococcota bacterium]